MISFSALCSRVNERMARKQRVRLYGDGEGDVFTLISVFSVFFEVSGEGLTMVVLVSFFSAGGFVTVVSLFSQAVRTAMPESRQIYLFI